MRSIKERNKEYYDSEIIPITKENYDKVLRITYKSMRQSPKVFIVIGGFFLLPGCAFLFLAKMSLFPSLSISLIIVTLFYGLGPLFYVKLAFHLAKKDPKSALRKHGHLSKFDEM